MSDVSPPNPAGPVRRLLLVDDDKRLLTAFEMYLKRSISVDIAFSGEAGLRLLAQNEYSVVISDMMMPSMTGVEFIMRGKELGTKAVFMLLTASRESDTAVQAFNDAGVFMVVNKPCPLRDLLEFVEAGQAEFERQ